jgi:hypothetical protein
MEIAEGRKGGIKRDVSRCLNFRSAFRCMYRQRNRQRRVGVAREARCSALPGLNDLEKGRGSRANVQRRTAISRMDDGTRVRTLLN